MKNTLFAVLVAVITTVLPLQGADTDNGTVVTAASTTATIIGPGTPQFPIGTAPKVMNYAVQNTSDIIVALAQGQTILSDRWQRGNGAPLTSKDDVDALVRDGLNRLLQDWIDDETLDIDLNGSIAVNVYGLVRSGPLSYTSPVFVDTNTFVKLTPTDTWYSPPDMSNYSVPLATMIPFYVTNVTYARVEVGTGSTQVLEVFDSLWGTTTNGIRKTALDQYGFVYLPTYAITNSSATGGEYWMKISVFDGKLRIFDGDSQSRAPAPFKMNQPRLSGANVIISSTVSDIGCGWSLQTSTDLVNWTDGPLNFVLPGSTGIQFKIPRTATNAFNRIVIKDATPHL